MDAISTFCGALAELPRDPSDTQQDPCHLEMLVSACSYVLGMNPWDTTIDDLRKGRDEAWTALGMVASETLSAQNYAPIGKQAAPVCLGTLCFMSVMRITWLIAMQQDRGHEDTTSLAQLLFCARHRLSCADPDRPLLTYSMSELVACVQALRNAFIQLPFHAELNTLIDLCEVVCARMLFETGTCQVFDIADNSLRTAHGDNEYSATNEFICMMWPSFVGFRRRLLVRRLFPTNVDQPAVDRDAMSRLCAWLQAKSNEIVYQNASPSLKRVFVRMHMRPGDREISQMQRPGVTLSDAGVVADTLAESRMAQINPRVNLSPTECIRLHLGEWSYDGPPEPLELGICIHDFMDMITQDAPGCGWSAYYSRLELCVEMDEVQRMTLDRPMVVQLFSHWQVVYANRVYWFNSIVASITFWLFLMEGAAQQKWTSQSAEYNSACRSEFYTDMLDTVVHNKNAAGSSKTPVNNAETVFASV